MADKARLLFLEKFATGIAGVYSGISGNINRVVAVLNVVEQYETMKPHINQIIASLEALKPKIVLEEGIAAHENLNQVLRIMKKEVAEITHLEAYLRLAIRSPKHNIITAINNLNKKLTALFAAEAAGINMAA